jgi:hypothetical protein
MTRRTGRAAALAFALAAALVVAPHVVQAHEERPIEAFPNKVGAPPSARGDLDAGAPATPRLVVCKPESSAAISEIPAGPRRAANKRLLGECRYEHIQDAVDAVTTKGTTIYVLPGTYREEPSRTAAAMTCGPRTGIMSYDEIKACPHSQNLIAILGDGENTPDGGRVCDGPRCDLQIEGTGVTREDVVVEGGFRDDGEWLVLNGIRGDRADGLVLRHFTVQLFEFNAVYVLDTNRFLIDDTLTRWNDEYGFLAFSTVNGVIEDCEAYNNADSGVYAGSASDLNADVEQAGALDGPGFNGWAVEIRRCLSHHNTLGYSGTAGNSVYTHDNDFFANATGIATDSLYPGHPGLPQDHGWFEGNRVYSNNVNYYARYIDTGVCDLTPAERGYRPAQGDPWEGTVCPVVPLPVGTGMVIAGGNYNFLHANEVWDNWRSGFRLIAVPAALRDELDPATQFDTSHGNRFEANVMGVGPGDADMPNGVDFWWDGTGAGNCWESNIGFDTFPVTSNSVYLADAGFYPAGLPTCADGGSIGVPFNPATQGPLVPCAAYDRSDREFRKPRGCTWMQSPPQPAPRAESNAAEEQIVDVADDVIAIAR